MLKHVECFRLPQNKVPGYAADPVWIRHFYSCMLGETRAVASTSGAERRISHDFGNGEGVHFPCQEMTVCASTRISGVATDPRWGTGEHVPTLPRPGWVV